MVHFYINGTILIPFMVHFSFQDVLLVSWSWQRAMFGVPFYISLLIFYQPCGPSARSIWFDNLCFQSNLVCWQGIFNTFQSILLILFDILFSKQHNRVVVSIHLLPIFSILFQFPILIGCEQWLAETSIGVPPPKWHFALFRPIKGCKILYIAAPSILLRARARGSLS